MYPQFQNAVGTLSNIELVQRGETLYSATSFLSILYSAIFCHHVYIMTLIVVGDMIVT